MLVAHQHVSPAGNAGRLALFSRLANDVVHELVFVLNSVPRLHESWAVPPGLRLQIRQQPLGGGAGRGDTFSHVAGEGRQRVMHRRVAAEQVMQA